MQQTAQGGSGGRSPQLQPQATPKTQSSRHRIHSIFPRKMVARQKAPTGRTMSLNMRMVGLPENRRWQQLQQICSDENLAASDAFLRSVKNLGECRTSTLTPKHRGAPGTASTQAHIGQQSQQQPLMATTFAMYSKEAFSGPTSPGARGSAVAAAQTGSLLDGIYRKAHGGIAAGGRSRLAGGPKYRKQVDLANAVLKIHSPSQLIASVQPGPQLDFLLSNADLRADFDSAVRDADGQRGSQRGEGSARLRKANSSQLSKESGNQDAILKPVIHFASSLRPSGGFDDEVDLAEHVRADQGVVVPGGPMLTEEGTASRACLEATISRRDRAYKVQTKLLMSDKTTLRMTETEQSQVSMKQGNNNITPGKHESARDVVARHLRVNTAQQTSSQDVAACSAFNSGMRRDTLLRKTMVDRDTSPIEEAPKVHAAAQPRRITTNIDVASATKPASADQPPTALASSTQSRENSGSPGTAAKKRNAPVRRLQKTAAQQRSTAKPAVVSVTFEEDARTFTHAGDHRCAGASFASNPRLQHPSDSNLASARAQHTRGSLASGSRKEHVSTTSPGNSQLCGRVRPKPVLSPAKMLKDQFKPILQEDVDPSPLMSASRKVRTKSINSPGSQREIGALVRATSEFGEGCTRGAQASPDHQISCKLTPIDMMAREPEIMSKQESTVYRRSSGGMKGSKSTSNAAVVQNFKQLKQRQIQLEAPQAIRRNFQKDGKQPYNQKSNKQKAGGAGEKLKLKQKAKTQPIACKFDQQAQTSAPTSRMETPYSTYGSLMPVSPHYAGGDLQRENGNDESSNAHRRASSPSNQMKSLHSNTHTRKGSSQTPNEEELYKQIAMGMIDQESKIVVVCNEHGNAQQQSQTPKDQRVVSPNLQRASRASNQVMKFPNQVTIQHGNHMKDTQKSSSSQMRYNRHTKKQRYTAENQLSLVNSATINDSTEPTSPGNSLPGGCQHMLHNTIQPMSARANSSSLKYAAMREFKAQPQVMSMARSGLKSPRMGQSRQATRYSYQRTAGLIHDQNSSPSVLSKKTNTLSQALGIRPRHASPNDNVTQTLNFMSSSGERESDRAYQSVLKYQTISGGAITINNARAKEFQQMRSKIKSQGAPRRRFVNQRQNLYNLMASGLKKDPASPRLFSHELGPTSAKDVLTEFSDKEAPENPVALETQSSVPEAVHQNEQTLAQDRPATDANGTSSAAFIALENNQFIACEDQQNTNKNDQFDSMIEKAEQSHQSHEPTQVSDATPRFHMVTQSQRTSDIASLSKNPNSLSLQQHEQRMDLPHNMSVEQAHFMISKTLKSDHLRRQDYYQKLHKRRNQTGRLCATHRNRENNHSAFRRDFITDEAKEIRTSLEYSGSIVTEPKFITKFEKKTAADFVRSGNCMQLHVPPDRTGLYVAANARIGPDYETFTYDRARQPKIQEDQMARTDEMFAVIQKHVARLKNRGPSPHKDLADKTIKTIAHTITLPNANSSSLAEEKSPIKVEYLLTADNSSFHTLYSPDQHVQHYVQNTEAHESQDTPDTDGSQSQRLSSPARKLIQIFRVDSGSGGTEKFDQVESATMDLRKERMSTKLLQKESSVDAKLSNPNQTRKNSVERKAIPLGISEQQSAPRSINRKSDKGNEMNLISCKTEVSHSQTTIPIASNADLPGHEYSLSKPVGSQKPAQKEKREHKGQGRPQHALSPQPTDRRSKLVPAQGGSKQAQRGFITIKQNYCVKEPMSTNGNRLATSSSRHAGSGRLSAEGGVQVINIPTTNQVISQENVITQPQVPTAKIRLRSQRQSEFSQVAYGDARHRQVSSRQLDPDDSIKPMIRLTSSTSGIFDLSQEGINPVPKLTHKNIGNNFNRQLSRKTHQRNNPQSLRGQEPNTKRTREQSMSISGVKMFNPDLSANSGAGTTQNKIEFLQFSQGDDINRVINIPATMPPKSVIDTPEIENTNNDRHSQGGLMVKMMHEANSIASKEPVDYERDVISTEKKYISTDQKSSMLIRSRITVNKSLTTRTKGQHVKGHKNSDPQVYNMTIERDDMTNARVHVQQPGSPERVANLTPPVPEQQTKL